jgi:hypothetical protein
MPYWSVDSVSGHAGGVILVTDTKKGRINGLDT